MESEETGAQMKAVAAFIINKLEKPPTIDKIAAEFHISNSTLKNRFRAHFKMGIKQYYQAARIRYAATKLEQGFTIKSVQIDFGYKSPGAFDRAFKQVYKIPPGAYVKLHKE